MPTSISIWRYESRVLPRDPALAIRAEKAFLDGQSRKPGVKAALDARLTGEALTAAYQRALDALEECTALVKVGLSPSAAVIGAIFIVAREGLEAVVILAALLAGLRGAENAGFAGVSAPAHGWRWVSPQ